MLQELLAVHNSFITAMKAKQGVLGAWYFGSLAHGTTDEYSDIDIVFLAEGDWFTSVDAQLDALLKGACDEIVLRWEESFNSAAIKNYGYLICHNQKLFQYDVFLLNKALIDDFMCQIHYTNLNAQDIVFDKDGSVRQLAEKSIKGAPRHEEIRRIIDTYWFHMQMSAKYFARGDFFKLEGVLRILMDTHAALLLTAYDKTTWGGSASKLHFIPKDKQKHLMRYACTSDFAMVRNNLAQSAEWLGEDVADVASADDLGYHQHLAKIVMPDWQCKTSDLSRINPADETR